MRAHQDKIHTAQLRFVLDLNAEAEARAPEVSRRKPAARSQFQKFSFKYVSVSQK